jgi:hypothetical protein
MVQISMQIGSSSSEDYPILPLGSPQGQPYGTALSGEDGVDPLQSADNCSNPLQGVFLYADVGYNPPAVTPLLRPGLCTNVTNLNDKVSAIKLNHNHCRLFE